LIGSRYFQSDPANPVKSIINRKTTTIYRKKHYVFVVFGSIQPFLRWTFSFSAQEFRSSSHTLPDFQKQRQQEPPPVTTAASTSENDLIDVF